MPKRPAFDSYWRLPGFHGVSKQDLIDALLAAGYEGVKNLSKVEMVARSHRLDRRLPIYELCTTKERKKFVRDRKLKTRNRMHLTNALMLADAEPQFHRFMDLPAELRVRIYEYYIEDTKLEPLNTVSEHVWPGLAAADHQKPKPLKCPSQPPLARISRQLRHEVLPVFYNEHEFTLDFIIAGSDPYKKLYTHSDSLLFLWSVPTEYISYIHRLRLEIHDGAYTNPVSNRPSLEFTIDIDKPEKMITDIVPHRTFCGNRHTNKIAGRMEEEITATLVQAQAATESGVLKTTFTSKLASDLQHALARAVKW